MSAKAKSILWILFAAAVAHVAGSYACMLFTVSRIDQVTSATMPRRIVYVSRRFRYVAPVYIPQLVNGWRQMKEKDGSPLESPKGLALIACSYALPAAGVFILLMILPKLIQEEESAAAKGRAFAVSPPVAITPPPAAAPAARAAPAVTPPPAAAVAPPPASRVQPPPASKVQPPPPSRAVTPPPPARTTPPPPRIPTPPPPARTTPPPPRRPS